MSDKDAEICELRAWANSQETAAESLRAELGRKYKEITELKELLRWCSGIMNDCGKCAFCGYEEEKRIEEILNNKGE